MRLHRQQVTGARFAYSQIYCLTSLHAVCLNCMVTKMEEGDIQRGEVMDMKSYFKFPISPSQGTLEISNEKHCFE